MGSSLMKNVLPVLTCLSSNFDGEPSTTTARIEADRMELTNFADAGDVSVLDARRVLVSRDGLDERTEISSSVATFADTAPRAATGNAGLVTVEADEVTLRDSRTIFSVSRGAGDGGTVAVTADRIELTGGGQIASGTLDLSTGRGGNVAVTSREELTISGQSRQINPRTGRPEPSGIFVSSESVAEAADRAGRATVSAPVITITNRGEISSESVSNQSSGRLTLSAEQLVIDGGEITTQAEGAGGGGRIEVRAGVIELRNGGLISAQSTGSGNAGSVTIMAPDGLMLDRLVLDRGEISTSAQQAGGGRITIQVSELIDLQDSRIESSVAQEAGNAGDISIDPDFLVLDDSAILARADAGVGGDISIVADNLVVSPDSLINAEAGEAGVDGTVVTSEPAVDLASALVVLAAPPLDADALLREPCALRRDVGTSSFTGVGRGGLPAAPDRPLGSAYRSAAEGGAAPGTNVRPAALTLAMHCSSTD
jgi:hypothetical protein